MSFLTEIKRRKVFRVAVVYAATGFVILQAAELMLPRLGIPDWVSALIVVLVILGFPIALVMGWALELTPEGLKVAPRRGQTSSDEPPPSLLGKRTVFASALLVVLGIGIGAGWFLRPATPVAEPRVVVTDKSIAVLPFADFSPEGDHAWFAHGLAEEVLNTLVRAPDLLVSARTSSFRFQDSTLDAREIAAELNVAHILEGSVRMAPDRLRVSAQLVRAADGFHLWSQTYDRPIDDMIAIQEDLAREIALAMQTSMDPEALRAMAQVGTRSVEAYQAFLQGVSLGTGRAGTLASLAHFERARELDPGFAWAHYHAANFWAFQVDPRWFRSGQTDAQPAEMRARFHERIELAKSTARSDLDRIRFRATQAFVELRYRDATALLLAYLAERPGDVDALADLERLSLDLNDDEALRLAVQGLYRMASISPMAASVYLRSAWRLTAPDQYIDQVNDNLRRWENEWAVWLHAQGGLLRIGEVELARDVLGRVGPMPPLQRALMEFRLACAEGRWTDARSLVDSLGPRGSLQRAHGLLLMGHLDEAKQIALGFEESGWVEATVAFAWTAELDLDMFPSVRQFVEREGIERRPIRDAGFPCLAPEHEP